MEHQRIGIVKVLIFLDACLEIREEVYSQTRHQIHKSLKAEDIRMVVTKFTNGTITAGN